jgi:hypothetical protein
MPCSERPESKWTGADLRNHASGAPSNADGNSHHSYRNARRLLRQRWFFGPEGAPTLRPVMQWLATTLIW